MTSKRYGSLSQVEDVFDGNHMALLSNAGSIDDLPNSFAPDFDSRSRQSGIVVATFNLLSTVVGGGTLSIPFAFKKCGWFVGLVITFGSMQISLMTLELLAKMARKLKSDKYADTMQQAIGPGFAEITNGFCVFILGFVLIAFMILMKDIAGDILEYFSEEDIVSSHTRSTLLIVIIAFCFPLMTAESLHGLRHVSFVGTFSVMILLFVIAWKALHVNTMDPLLILNIRAGPEEYTDVLTAIPIVFIAFFCQFNFLGVYSNLQQPTEQRTSVLVNSLMAGACLLFSLFGLAGYLFAFDETKDNVLQNFSSKDPSLIVARFGLLVTLMCQIPMITLPCRDAIMQLLGLCCKKAHVGDCEAALPPATAARSLELPTRNLIQSTAILQSPASFPSSSSSSSSVVSGLVSAQPHDHTGSAALRWQRTVTVFFLISTCLLLSEFVPGVSTIWTLAGSSVCIILGFLLPATAYICLWRKLNKHNRRITKDLVFSWVLLVISVILVFLCTYQSIRKIGVVV